MLNKLVYMFKFMCLLLSLLSLYCSNVQGFTVRGGVSSFGWGRDSTLNDGQLKNRYSRLETFVEAAVCKEWTVLKSLYLGLDAQLGNLGVFSYSNSGTSWYYSPNFQVRFGGSWLKAQPYVAVGLGYTKLIGTTVITNNEAGNFTYSLRVGSSLNVTNQVFADIFGQLVQKFRLKNSSTGLNESSFGWSVGASIGWRF